MLGTGPWVLTEHKDKQYAVFTRNERYWGPKPALESVRWKVMPDHQTILLALQKGEIDLIFGSDGDMLNLDAFAALQKEGTYKTEISYRRLPGHSSERASADYQGHQRAQGVPARHRQEGHCRRYT